MIVKVIVALDIPKWRPDEIDDMSGETQADTLALDLTMSLTSNFNVKLVEVLR